MANSNSGGVSFSPPAYSGTLEGHYTKTDSGYFTSHRGENLFIGRSCKRSCEKGLWMRTVSGKADYVSALHPLKNKENTFSFDVFNKDTGERSYYLLIQKEDRLKIISRGGLYGY